MEWFWLALTIALIVVEVATVQLVTIWFAVGAGVTSLITALTNIEIYWQIVIFALISIALLLATRPLVKKLLAKRSEKQKTNLELLIGKEAVVVEEIDNVMGKGAVKIGGAIWSARSLDGRKIFKDEIVVFREIDGNKAIVE
ncbi:MAG: NfeD family protein [Clostridia bacterium]|nr:NfeD family protein [Clostridia bacterium]